MPFSFPVIAFFLSVSLSPLWERAGERGNKSSLIPPPSIPPARGGKI
jgi:hypothetical protein